MLLDRIDIDAHGPLNCVELGPFTEHLNAVCSPEGSGKTAIARFVRDSLVTRDYPLGMLSSSAGRVVWADRNGLIHCRREMDGTGKGRRTIEFESRGDFDPEFGSLEHSWISGGWAATDLSRAAGSIQLPESIVDGVITDAAVTSVARVVSACVRSGLDSPETYRSLPLRGESSHRDSSLREELAGVEAELAQLGDIESDHQTLVARRNWLRARLARPHRSKPATHRYDGSHHTDWQQRLTRLHDRARQLRARQNELRRWIAELDRAGRPHPSHAADANSPRNRHHGPISDQELRRQLDDLNAQMIRWRRTLLEVRGLRNVLQSSQGYFATHPFAPLDAASLRRVRLDGFLHAIDRYDRSRSWDDGYPEAYRPLHRIDDIDNRIDSATRQIDWLLERYAGADKVQSAWYETFPTSENHPSADRARGTTLYETLRTIREDLRQVQYYTSRGPDQIAQRAVSELEELRRCEQWLVAAIEQLNHHRDSLIHGRADSGQVGIGNWSDDQHDDSYVVDHDRSQSIAELNRITAELEACLSQAAEIRRSSRSLPVIDPQWYDDQHEYDWVDRDALVAELRAIDDRIASTSRIQWLRWRRSQLHQQLRNVSRPMNATSPLAEAASRWLVRLSAGRLQRIDWPHRQFRDNPNSYHRDRHHRTGVTINGSDESQSPAADRALAVMAVRMAAGDLLAKTGRHVPLVFETHGEMFRNVEAYDRSDLAPLAYFQHGDHAQSNHPIAAALGDYSQSGRQVVVLTSSQEFASQLSRAGARLFQIHAQQVVHAHRPIWRPNYETEQYVGPHPHTYGLGGNDDLLQTDRRFDDRISASRDSGSKRPIAANVDINRDFDMASGEMAADHDSRDRVARSSCRTDWARDGVDFRDGYYFANSYTTADPLRPAHHDPGNRVSESPRQVSAAAPPQGTVPAAGRAGKSSPASPFFLSVDSPIDQAPSIDAVGAARLRGLNVTHINHLMQQDPNRLADALGLANVDAATIRRWQAECRLVCRVPQIRGFDARVLVGCGVTTPAQLSSIHPVDLLQEVEAFLATERGQQILLSGSSHELSRITSWIAAANSSSGRDLATFGSNRNGKRPSVSRSGRRSYYRGFNPDSELDSERDEYGDRDDDELQRYRDSRRRRRIIRTMNERDAAGNANGRSAAGRSSRDEQGDDHEAAESGRQARSTNGSSSGSGRGSRHRNSRSGRASRNGSGRSNGTRGSRGTRASRGTVGEERSETGRARRRRTSRPAATRPASSRDVVQYERERPERNEPERNEREHESSVQQEADAERELRFYLQRESPIVDAPSIGSRMGERLNAIGIDSVDDLLNADPDTVAAELGHRRVDADTILVWQQQATLVCRVPMLRGHDAQLLVASEVTTPEELAAADAEDLLGIVDPIARSSEGKRIIRGGKMPDLEEVTDWIHCAQHTRELRAA